MMKKFILSLIVLIPTILSAQNVSRAVAFMEAGNYQEAKTRWIAYDLTYGGYQNKIAICETCLQLQSQAKVDMSNEHYTKAIEKYQNILSYNPNDRNAKSQIQICKNLRDEYNSKHSLKKHTNEVYGYTIMLPGYMQESRYSTPEKVTYNSNDGKISVVVTTTVDTKSTQSQLLKAVVNKYKDSKIEYNPSKGNWTVVRGYLKNGNIFYDKTIVSSRLSQYDDYVNIVVSAVVTSAKSDSRGDALAKIIASHFKVNSTGRSVKSSETDSDRWAKALKLNTKQGYDKYLRYANAYSTHKPEAYARKYIIDAVSQYNSGNYFSAKRWFDSAEAYLTDSEKLLYMDCCYKLCTDGTCTIALLDEFSNKFPSHPYIGVIKGCYVKTYCRMGMTSSAKKYVKNNYGIWFSEKTHYSRKQWMRFIRNYRKRVR